MGEHVALLLAFCLFFLSRVGRKRRPAMHPEQPDMPGPGLAKFISKLIISVAYERTMDAPRFRGRQLAVYAGRGAAPGARLCRPAGGALWHHPRAMGGAGQGGTRRG